MNIRKKEANKRVGKKIANLLIGSALSVLMFVNSGVASLNRLEDLKHIDITSGSVRVKKLKLSSGEETKGQLTLQKRNPEVSPTLESPILSLLSRGRFEAFKDMYMVFPRAMKAIDYPRPKLPELPNELWDRIFQFVVGNRIDSWPIRIRNYSSIGTVSKDWRDLSRALWMVSELKLGCVQHFIAVNRGQPIDEDLLRREANMRTLMRTVNPLNIFDPRLADALCNYQNDIAWASPPNTDCINDAKRALCITRAAELGCAEAMLAIIGTAMHDLHLDEKPNLVPLIPYIQLLETHYPEKFFRVFNGRLLAEWARMHKDGRGVPQDRGRALALVQMYALDVPSYYIKIFRVLWPDLAEFLPTEIDAPFSYSEMLRVLCSDLAEFLPTK